ncbi:flagellar hook-associated protein FlgK [Thiobacter aerophilum]|uniref:Flagellar hook-associated protein 1 n=1 Tax=Thiobacter aerophilum TaxID=3121275 RepID=A0ABV0EGA2_9BURK
MTSSIIDIGVRALNVAQYGLVTTQHNIANVNTPGFHRQEIRQSTLLPFGTGAGWLGQGAKVDTVKRIYNEFLDNQVLATTAQSAFFETYSFQVRQLDNLLGDPNSGLSPALQQFFTGVQTVANDPASVPARQLLISSAQALVARFNAMDQRIQGIREGVDTQLQGVTAEINAYAAQIAQLNEKIVLAQNTNRQPPNDLLDQRDQLIAELNERVRATVVKQDDGTFNVFIGNGQALVVGHVPFRLAAVRSTLDPDNLDVVLQTGGGGQIALNQLDLTGGKLGGLLAFRREALDAAQNGLGRVAVTLAETFNNQHRLGQDLLGALGGDFFKLASTTPTVKASDANTGTGVLSASLVTSNAGAAALTTGSYRLTYQAGSNSYVVEDLVNHTTNTVAAGSLATAIPGLTLSMTGSPTDGDSFLVLPSRYGARDISLAIDDVNRIAAGAPIRASAAVSNTGSATITPGTVDATSQPPLNPNLLAPVTITFTSPTTFDVSGVGTGNPTGLSYTSGGAISFNGWTVQISGVPAAGDTFTIGPNTGGIGDGRNALELAALQIRNLLAGNTTTYQGAYSQMVSAVGSRSQEVQINAKAQAALLTQTKQAQQEVSGVNLDEEAANLLRYQQAYQAAAKVVQTGNILFDTILGLR